MILKLKRTNRMSNALDSIGKRMGKIIHRVNAPLITGAMVSSMCNSIDYRIAHNDIGGCHVNLCPKNMGAILKLTVLHFLKEFEIFFYTAVTIRTVFSRLRQGTSVLTDFVTGKITYIGLTKLYQLNSVFIKLREVIGSVKLPVIPGESKPFYISLN